MDGEVVLVGIHAFHNDGLARQRTPRHPNLDTDGHTWTSDGPLDLGCLVLRLLRLVERSEQ